VLVFAALACGVLGAAGALTISSDVTLAAIGICAGIATAIFQQTIP